MADSHTEVEIKLKLRSRADYDRALEACLRDLGIPREDEDMVNTFFEGKNGEIKAKKGAFRIRTFKSRKDALCTIKRRHFLKHGVGAAEEIEQSIPDDIAHRMIASPDDILSSDIDMFRKVVDMFAPETLEIAGSFENRRIVFAWEDTFLELDHSKFPMWGIDHYEIEIETSKPKEIKPRLTKWLEDAGIAFTNSKATKHKILLTGKVV
eukprot:TRINITY_DN55744_c0_g2_i2.p1 TRINITY_DN55744_c0_g2~~TRINITY_DN55744_c0_g2_i2.p1  ORF type:complete len:241 (+),score=57.21 TRINITY_DN55744_c0_g2_i2:98-724(+)